MKKSIFLVLTLAIPVSIFLFLKIFGSNEFEVPLLFEDGIPDCSNSGKPHQVPDIKLNLSSGVDKSTAALDGFIVFGVFREENKQNLQERIIQLVRIQDAFYEIGSPTFVLIVDRSEELENIQLVLEEVGLLNENYQLGSLNQIPLDEYLKCGLGLNANEVNNHLVMVDPERKIRGIYDGLDMEQTEQLILELKILRKKD